MRQSIKTYLKVILNLITALIVLLLCIFLLPKCILLYAVCDRLDYLADCRSGGAIFRGKIEG